MNRKLGGLALVLAAACLPLAAKSAQAAGCGSDGGGFNAWMADFRQKARASGISEATLARALEGHQAGEEVFARKGYDGTRLREVAAEQAAIALKSKIKLTEIETTNRLLAR